MTISGGLFPVEDDAYDEHHVPDIYLAGAVEVGIRCEKPQWRVAEDGGHGSRHVFDAHHPVVVHVTIYRLHLLHVDVEPLGGVYLLAVINGELHAADINGSTAERQGVVCLEGQPHQLVLDPLEGFHRPVYSQDRSPVMVVGAEQDFKVGVQG